MSQVKVTTRFRILEFVDQFIDGTTASAIGRAVIEESKALIASGQSPVRGFGRYQRYSASYSGAIKNKRYARHDKNVRPVNLNLSGSLLRAFGYKVRDQSVDVGITNGSARDKEIARYHQTGTQNMPARPLFPTGDEEWAQRVMRAIRELYGKRLEKVIKEANK